jgi:hypothetical protein
MNEADTVQLNIDRFRLMLRSELDASVRHTVETLLAEFEARLLPTSTRPERREN